MSILAISLAFLFAPAAPNPQNQIAASPVGEPAADMSLSRWGVLDEIARREWTTEKEPRARVSKFRWIEPGRVLEARHGFQSRLQFGEAKFADTVQLFVLDPKTGRIDVTYTYEDGRPPLKTVIRIEPDGTAVETFKDANGIEKRNLYKSPRLSLNTIERQEMKDGTWAQLGTTRKVGLTQEEIAENKRRAEEARQMALAEANARQAAEAAQRAAEQAAYEAQQQSYVSAEEPSEPMGASFLRELQGMAAQAQAEAERSTQRTNQMIANVQAQEAARRAREAREEANRIAAENARRVQEANARQQAIADQYAQRQANNEAQAGAAAAQAEAERTRRLAAERQTAETAETERQQREAQVAAESDRRRQAEERQLAEQRRKEEEARRPVAFKEGVVACNSPNSNSREYRCDGPLQVTYSDLSSSAGMAAIGNACGGGTVRDLGTSGTYRIFGCGFGIHPTDRDYPGNRDVPAALGLYIPSRATYYCPRTTNAYCRGS